MGFFKFFGSKEKKEELQQLQPSIDTAVEMVREEKDGGAVPVPDYTDINVSDKVVKIIQSYVGIVNKMVWRKEVFNL